MQPISSNLFKSVQSKGIRVASHIRALPSSLLDMIRSVGSLLPHSTLSTEAGIAEGPLRMGSAEFLKKFRSRKFHDQPIVVTERLILPKGFNVAKLPRDLTVEADMVVIYFTSLRLLPEGLQVRGDLNLSGCTSLTALPENLQVGGNLSLYGCTSLIALPAGFDVGGDLYLNGCTSLTALPERLSVGGDLILRSCTSLRELPEGLRVGGDLNLNGCTSLTELPNYINDWGVRADGKTRWVHLANTRISDALRDRLIATEVFGMRFNFIEPVANFVTLDDAINFWSDIFLMEGVSSISLNLGPDQEEVLNYFLSRLAVTPDYRNSSVRLTLAERIHDMLKEMQENDKFKEAAFLIINEGLSNCDDRVIDQLNLMWSDKRAG